MNPLAEIDKWDGAKCQTVEPEIWFDKETIPIAVEICNSCPLKEKCAQYAIDEQIEYGVWGGVTEETRQKILKRIRLKRKV